MNRRRRMPQGPTFLFIALTTCMIGACTSTTTTEPPASRVPIAPTQRPIATVDGSRLNLQDLQAALLEAHGAEVVRERALDRAVAREAARRSIEIDEATIARERTFLVETLSSDEDRAELLLQRLRRARGLGPIRFSALLRRNALLRALVSEDVEIDPKVVRGAWDSVHGPRRVARVIATRDLRTAEAVRARLLAGEDFAVVAVETSIDSSATRGGRLAPISRLDPSWPAGFRRALFELEPGRPSASLPLEGRMLVIEVVEELPADGVSFEEGRPQAERAARLAAERLLMDRLARRLVPDGSIEALDPSLDWSLQQAELDQLRR